MALVPLHKLATKTKELKAYKTPSGRIYTVRSNRDRFFYPYEWFKFYDALRPKQKLTFAILINTGARINEAHNIKVGDIDFERHTIILRVTKVKAKKGEKNPRPRTIRISTQLTRKLKSYIISHKLGTEDYLGVMKPHATHTAMKIGLAKARIKDHYMFSPHNIRKTHGNYLKAFGVDIAEICLRLGHDYNTFIKSYGSPDIFSFKDVADMRVILGDLYQR